MRHEVTADDTVRNGKVFIADMGSDGMKTDLKGNLLHHGHRKRQAWCADHLA